MEKIKNEKTNTYKNNKRNSYVLERDCESDLDCSDISNSVCSPLTNKCICKRGYFFDSGECIAGKISIFFKP